MATNEIEIVVDVVGVSQAEKDLNKIEQSTADIGEGVKGVGESFKGVGDIVSAQGGVMGEAFGALGDSIGGLVDGFGQFGEVMQSGGKMGLSSMLGLLGPLAAIASAVALAVEAWRQFSGSAKEAEQIEAAVSAAAGDLTAKMEELAEKGIKATHEQLKKLIELNTESRLGLEILNEKNANLTKVYKDQIQAQKDMARTIEYWNRVNGDAKLKAMDLKIHQDKLSKSNEAVKKAQEELTSEYEKSLPAVEKAQEYQRNLAMTQQEALDALKGQLESQKEYNDLLLETAGLSDYEKSIQQKKRELEIEQRLLGQRSQSVEQIQALTKVIEDENKARAEGDLLALKEIKNEQEIAKLKEDENKRLKDEAKARSEAYKSRRQQVIGEESQINALKIQLEKQGIDEQLALAVNSYQLQVALNKDNKNQLTIAALQYQQQLQAISDQQIQAEKDKVAKQKEINQLKLDQESAFLDELLNLADQKIALDKETQNKINLLDIQLNNVGYDQQIALQQEQMKQELALVEEGSLQALEIKKRYQLQSKGVYSESTQMLKDFADAQAQSFAASAASAIMAGESIQAVLKQSLTALATEALAKSLYEGAAGLAALAIGGPIQGLSAAEHFAASAAFAGVATVAGLAGAAIPAPKGGSSSGSASPSGLSQSSEVQRPEAPKTEPMVFNMNFQGSTIYDTKESAKRALSDEIVKYINEPRRGSPRLRVN